MSDTKTKNMTKKRARRNDVGHLQDRTDQNSPVAFTGKVKVGLDIVDIQLLRVPDVPEVEKVFERSNSSPDYVIFELDPENLNESKEFLASLEFDDNMGVAWIRELPEFGKTLEMSFDLGILTRHRAQALPKNGQGLFRICVSLTAPAAS